MLDELTLRTLLMRDFLSDTIHPRLNIGPGMANLEKVLPEDDVKITLDINPKCLSQLRGISNTHLVNASAECLPFRSNCIPTVTTQGTFQVLKDQCAFLDELKRVLRQDGIFCITIEWRVWYQPEKQTFKVDELDTLYFYLHIIGLEVTHTKHLSYNGDWYDEKEKGFSIWIHGKNTLKYHYHKLHFIE